MKVTKTYLKKIIAEEYRRVLTEDSFAAIDSLSKKASTPEMQKALAILSKSLASAHKAASFALKNGKSVEDAKQVRTALSHALKAIELKSDYAIHNLTISLADKQSEEELAQQQSEPQPTADGVEKATESALSLKTSDQKRVASSQVPQPVQKPLAMKTERRRS